MESESKPLVCLVASAKGGVGKSTTAIGLSIAMARQGHRVLLVDCDVSSRSLDIFFGAEEKNLFHFGDVLEERCSAEDAMIHPCPALLNLSVCAAPHREEEEAIAARYPGGFPEALYTGCRRLIDAHPADVILLDTGSGYAIPQALAPLADWGLVCSEQSPASIRAAGYTVSILSAAARVRLVICSFDIRAAHRGERAGMLEMIDACRLKCAAVIPYDPRLARIIENGMQPLPSPKLPAMLAYQNLTCRLEGREVPLFDGIRHMNRRHAL